MNGVILSHSKKKKKRQHIEDCAPKLSNLNICVCCAPPKNVEITQCIMRYMYWVRKNSSKAKIPSSAEFIEGHKHFYKLSRHEENISFHPRTKRNLQRKKKRPKPYFNRKIKSYFRRKKSVQVQVQEWNAGEKKFTDFSLPTVTNLFLLFNFTSRKRSPPPLRILFK